MMMTLNTYLMSASPRRLVSRVTSLTNALGTVATSLCIAGLATMLTARTAAHLAAAKASAAMAARRASPTGDVAMRLAHALGAAVHTAVATAFDDTFRLMIVAAVASAVLSLALRRPRAVLAEIADEGTVMVDGAVHMDILQGEHAVA